MRFKKQKIAGFTLIEILIVVVLIGIMAAMVIPKFSNAAAESRESMLLENLRILKAQIGVYRAQHWDVAPGYPNGDTSVNPTEADFIDYIVAGQFEVQVLEPATA